jgi:hypothetical protein
MKAANARIIWSHCRLSVVGAKQRYDRELYPFEIELGNEPPCVSILRAFVTLTANGLRPNHITQECLSLNEFTNLLSQYDRAKVRLAHRLSMKIDEKPPPITRWNGRFEPSAWNKIDYRVRETKKT